MATTHLRDIDEVVNHRRKYSEWGSPQGFDMDSLPWRLWDKSKKLNWDPADLDFSQDAKDWASMTDDQRLSVAGLARGFMVGEEGVTLDIMPLVIAISDEGRTEETIFLTSFAYEEAKHVDFFRRWFNAIKAEPTELEELARERMRARGVEPASRDRDEGMFESELPRVMRRLLVDRSPQAFLDAGVTYNQFIEGCLAISGYRMWNYMFEQFGVLPGLREGLTLVQRDERRHIAYGTYLCRRLIAANPDLFDFAKDRMYQLRDGYFQGGQQAQQRAPVASAAQEGNGQGGGYGGGGGEFAPFLEHVRKQVERRIEIMSKARELSAEQAEAGTGTEEAEEELEAVS